MRITLRVSSDADYLADQNSWLSDLTARAHAAGMISIGNVSLGTEHPAAYQAALAVLDGAEDESFQPIVLGSSQDAQDVATIAEGTYTESQHKWFLAGFDYAPPAEPRQTFALAQFLQEANGYSVFNLDPVGNAVPTFWPSMIAAMQLGPALSADQARSVGGQTVYERDFANGVVVFNPSQSTTASFSPVPGGTYSGRDCSALGDTCSTLTNVSSLTLGADGGAVLLRP